jgi:LacI family transcriptional regulator
VIIPNILNSFFAKVFSGIEKMDERDITLCVFLMNQQRKKHTLEMLSNAGNDGFIVSVSEEAQKIKITIISQQLYDGTQ